MSRRQTKYLQRRQRKQNVILALALILTNALMLNISLLATLVFVMLVVLIRWKESDKHYLVGFCLLNLLFYPISFDSSFLCLLVALASTELIYLGNLSRVKELEQANRKETINNIVTLMDLNNNVVSTVFNADKRYDFNVHNGKYEEKNNVQVSIGGKYITEFVNNNIVQAKQMLGVRELSGEGLLAVIGSVDLKDLNPYRRDPDISSVYENIEQELFMFKSYVDNRVDLLRKQLEESYSLDGYEDISVVDYTQELMRNKIKVEQRFSNIQTLVDQLVLKLKAT